jgi:hypothetical protein
MKFCCLFSQGMATEGYCPSQTGQKISPPAAEQASVPSKFSIIFTRPKPKISCSLSHYHCHLCSNPGCREGLSPQQGVSAPLSLSHILSFLLIILRTLPHSIDFSVSDLGFPFSQNNVSKFGSRQNVFVVLQFPSQFTSSDFQNNSF